MCQVWWGIMALERVCISGMWLQQMAQLSIRVGSPAVCSPASCFTAIKYHQGRAKKWEGRSKGGREGEREVKEKLQGKQGEQVSEGEREQERRPRGRMEEGKMWTEGDEAKTWCVEMREVFCDCACQGNAKEEGAERRPQKWMRCTLSVISSS